MPHNESCTPSTPEEKKPFWAKCDVCKHCWPAAYLPMEMGLVAKLMKGLRCPKCGVGSKKILIAKQDNGILKEAA